MPEQFRNVQPGEPFRPSAKDWNAAMAAARQAASTSTGSETGTDTWDHVTIYVRNLSSTGLVIGSVCHMATARIPVPDLSTSKQTPAFSVVGPTSYEDAIAIAIEPIAVGSYGRAAIAGVVLVQVDFVIWNDLYVAFISGVKTHLISSSTPFVSGSIGRVLYRTGANATGIHWALVHLQYAAADGGGLTGTFP